VGNPIQPGAGCGRLLRHGGRCSGIQQISGTVEGMSQTARRSVGSSGPVARSSTGMDSFERTTMALSFPNKSRDAIEEAIDAEGFQLWRFVEKTEA